MWWERIYYKTKSGTVYIARRTILLGKDQSCQIDYTFEGLNHRLLNGEDVPDWFIEMVKRRQKSAKRKG